MCYKIFGKRQKCDRCRQDLLITTTFNETNVSIAAGFWHVLIFHVFGCFRFVHFLLFYRSNTSVSPPNWIEIYSQRRFKNLMVSPMTLCATPAVCFNAAGVIRGLFYWVNMTQYPPVEFMASVKVGRERKERFAAMARASKVVRQMSFSRLCERDRKPLQPTWDHVRYCSILFTAGNHIFCDRPAKKKGTAASCSEKDIRYKVAFWRWSLWKSLSIWQPPYPAQSTFYFIFFSYPYYNGINGISSVFSVRRNSQLDGRSPCSGTLRCSQPRLLSFHGSRWVKK